LRQSLGDHRRRQHSKQHGLAQQFYRSIDRFIGFRHAAPGCDLVGLQFWLALATWKLAMIFEGITRRRLDNPGNSATSPETLRRTTEHLADLAATLV
jgi:hypothetical protein